MYTDYNSKLAYFCCKGCPAEFKKDPAKCISKLEKEGVTLDKAPALPEDVIHIARRGCHPADGSGASEGRAKLLAAKKD